MMHYFKLEEDVLVNTDCYSYYYTNFKIMNYLFFNMNADLNSIYNYLEEFYGENTINKELLNNHLTKEFNVINTRFCLTNEQEDLFKCEKKLEKFYFEFLNKDSSYLNSIFLDFLYDDNKSIELIIAYVFALANQNFKFDNETLLVKGFNLLKNMNIYYSHIDNFINNDCVKAIEIKKWILSEEIESILSKYSFDTLKSFVGKSIYFVIASLSKNINKMLIELINYNINDDIENIKNIFDQTIVEYLNSKNKKYHKIFINRLCHVNGRETLEKIADSFNITRERVRQMAKQIDINLRKKLVLYTKQINDSLYNIIISKGNYITNDELLTFFKDEKYIYYLAYVFSDETNRIMYNDDNKIFYDKYSFNYVTIKSNLIKEFNRFITLKQFNALNFIEKKYIENNYVKRLNNTVYAINGITDNELILDVLDDVFKSGYKCYSKDDFELLCSKIKETYDTDYTINNSRVVSGILSRANYRNIGRGVLISPKFIVSLDENLKNNIIQYLQNENDVVYYSTIYKNFEKELINNGINNRYYLKGVLDDVLPNEYKPQRDYVLLNNKFITPREYIEKYVEEQKGVINLSELKTKFNNIENYVFMNYINNFQDVIWLKYEESFILARNIPDFYKYYDLINDNIKILFNSLKTEIISISKLYSRLLIVNSEIFSDLKIINSSFAFNSYIKYLFKDTYYIVRNYISTNSEIQLTRYNIVLNYIKDLNKVTSKIIGDYVNRMHLPPLSSFLDFIQTISDEFIQINSEVLIPKENLKITNASLEIIKRNLNYYIDTLGCVDLRKYFDYSSLPLVNFPWNKHLLVGVVRTYLKLEYDIEYTDKQYNVTDYIIRRTY